MKDLKVRRSLKDARNDAGVQTRTPSSSAQLTLTSCLFFFFEFLKSVLALLLHFFSLLLHMFRLVAHPSLLTCQGTPNPKTSPDPDASLRGGQRAKGAEGTCAYS